jgi:hypothetical protein
MGGSRVLGPCAALTVDPGAWVALGLTSKQSEVGSRRPGCQPHSHSCGPHCTAHLRLGRSYRWGQVRLGEAGRVAQAVRRLGEAREGWVWHGLSILAPRGWNHSHPVTRKMWHSSLSPAVRYTALLPQDLPTVHSMETHLLLPGCPLCSFLLMSPSYPSPTCVTLSSPSSCLSALFQPLWSPEQALTTGPLHELSMA